MSDKDNQGSPLISSFQTPFNSLATGTSVSSQFLNEETREKSQLSGNFVYEEKIREWSPDGTRREIDKKIYFNNKITDDYRRKIRPSEEDVAKHKNLMDMLSSTIKFIIDKADGYVKQLVYGNQT